MSKKNPDFYPVILAGGRGTRFWPLSRRRRAKQLLTLDGKKTMIQQTVARLTPLASAKKFWIITNGDLRPAILRQLPALPKPQVLAEPVGRNTAPAIGLAAFLLLRENPSAVIGMFPSDHVIADEARYRETIERGVKIAAAGENIVVLGIRPTRAETGYGYIETGASYRRNCTARAPVYRKARRSIRRGIREGGQLLLEQRHVSVECAHARECIARAPAEDRALA